MNTTLLREQLHRQVNELPDELIREIADFVAFVLARRRMLEPYTNWTEDDWQQFTLSQFFRDTDDDIEYSLDDAQEVYQT